MKTMKKFLAIALALVLALSLAVPALAVEEGEPEGTPSTPANTITVNNAIDGKEYTAYKLFAVESYNEPTGTYLYKLAKGWEGFFVGEYADYITTVGNAADGYISWTGPESNSAELQAFAQAALAWAKANDVEKFGPVEAENNTAEITVNGLGYYLVESNVGVMVSLDVANPDATVTEKNSEPSIDKEVQEDSDSSWGDSNHADVGQVVNFHATITAYGTNQIGWVMHDKMTNLTFQPESVAITLNGAPVAASNYSVVTEGLTDGCTFHIVFEKAFLDTLKNNDEVLVEYSAILEEGALTTKGTNDTHLEYKDGNNTTHETEDDHTDTYTAEIEILKKDGTTEKPLAGAEFQLKNKDGEIAVVENGKFLGWVSADDIDENGIVTKEGDLQGKSTVLTSNDEGKIEVKGLDDDVYTLTETKAPAGYNKLGNDITVTVTVDKDNAAANDNSGDITTVEYEIAGDENGTGTGTIEVSNFTGTELPSTGGIGTTIFYIVGALLVVGAGVVLITRRRVAAQD